MYLLLLLLFILQQHVGIPDKFRSPQAHCRHTGRDVVLESLDQNKIDKMRKSKSKERYADLLMARRQVGDWRTNGVCSTCSPPPSSAPAPAACPAGLNQKSGIKAPFCISAQDGLRHPIDSFRQICHLSCSLMLETMIFLSLFHCSCQVYKTG